MRWILGVFIGLVVLALLALGAVLFMPSDRIAGIAAERFKAATGRALTITGETRPSFWPVLGISTGPVRVANADWSDEGPLLAAEALEIGVDAMALVRGDIRITKVRVDAPQIVLETAADGRVNWDMSAASEPVTEQAAEAAQSSETGGGVPVFSLDEAVVTGARLTVIDRAAGTRNVLDRLEAVLRLPDFDGVADLSLEAAMNGQPVALAASVEGVATFLTSGAVPTKVTASAGGSTLAFSGRAGLTPLAAGGTLSVELSDMDAVFALLGMAAPDLPKGLGRTAAVEGEVTATGAGELTLRDGTIRLDGNTVRANADLSTTGARPRITAQIAAGALDLSSLAGGGNGAGGGADAPVAAGWPRDPIDVSALQAVDAEISFAAESLDLGLATLGRTSLLTTLDNGRAVTEIRELRAYDGAFSGSFVVNSRGGLSVRTGLTGAGVALHPLLVQLAGYDRLLATGDMTLNLLGVGSSLHALMNSLDGTGALRLGQGELRGFDLAGMIRNLDPGFVGAGQKTIFDSVAATFRVENGVLRNDDLAVTSPLVNASGTGRIGLGAQDIDYRLLPVLMEGADNQGIKVPVIVSGPWADPRFRLDLEALVKQEFGDEIDALKDKAETAVTEKISEELGVDVESLDTLEDTLKEELEDRATRGILDLLGGNR